MTNARDIASRWFFKYEWTFKALPPPMDYEVFGKALINCASADGKLAPEEREWIIGYLACNGASDAVLEKLGHYQGDEDLDKIMSQSKVVSGARPAFLFDALRACAADGAIHEKERAAVTQLAGAIGVGPDLVAALEKTLHEEEAARTRRIKLIFPEGTPF
jgi:uncharacterized membrane protein YebE (DUF533 family)